MVARLVGHKKGWLPHFRCSNVAESDQFVLAFGIKTSLPMS